MLLDGFKNRYTGIRGFEAYGVGADGRICGTVYGGGHFFEHVLDEAHHPVVILVGHVDLHHGELRVVGLVHPFVAEVFGKFIDPFKTTYDEAFEVELIGNAEVQWDVERIVVGDERTGRGTPRDGLEDWGFHLHISCVVEDATHGRNDFVALAENLFHAGVYHEVDIALAVADFRIGELIVDVSVGIFFHDWKRTKAF